MRTEKANETPKQLAMNLLGQVLGARPAEPRTTLPKNGSKTPRLNRYAAIQRLFEADIFGNKQLVDTRTISSSGLTYNFVDLFAGAGGLSLGFEQANFHGVAAIEVENDACVTYRHNFPRTVLFDRPIEDVREGELRDAAADHTIHVVSGGPPCQGFSVAGRRDPDDSRNRLFAQFARVVDCLKPWYVVLENVPGILTMRRGAFYRDIVESFARIGYPEMAVAVLESAAFGVSQIRPRAVFIANRFGKRNPFPLPTLEERNYVAIEAAIHDLEDHPQDPSINHEWTKHSRNMEERLSRVPPGGSLYPTYLDAWKRQYPGVPSMTIKENHGGTHIHPHRNRVLSAREMARLQGFPDSFHFRTRMKRVMWQVGNAVPPPLARHIALALRPSLDELATGPGEH